MGQNETTQINTNSDLIPYGELTEGEKQFDRITAMETLKAIVAIKVRDKGRREWRAVPDVSQMFAAATLQRHAAIVDAVSLCRVSRHGIRGTAGQHMDVGPVVGLG